MTDRVSVKKVSRISGVLKKDGQLNLTTDGINLIGVVSREGMCTFETELKQFYCQKLF